MREPDFQIDGKALRLWSGCCVYAWKRQSRYLYIGSSVRGLSRPLGHTVINIIEPIQDNDTLEAWFFTDSNSALEFESQMIVKHRPLHNIAGTGRPFRPPQAKAIEAKKAANRQRRIERDRRAQRAARLRQQLEGSTNDSWE